MSAGNRPNGASALTIRVSTDSGRTYDRPLTLAVPHEWAATQPFPSQLGTRWPPCQCPQHRQPGTP